MASVAIGCAGADDGAGSFQNGVVPDVSSDIVISQIYGAGGASGAPFVDDYVELFNRGAASVSVTGWSVQYASSSGTSWQLANLSGSIPAGGYYLVQLASSGATGSSLPAADATGSINMSGSTGKIALVTNQTALTCGTGCVPSTSIRDFVGYGSANSSEGSDAPTLSTANAGFRAAGGCTDTDNNAADFSTGSPAPRNSSSAHNTCTGTPPPPPIDAGGGNPPPVDAPTGGGTGDGTPTRIACTGTFGTQMNTSYGRLDGFLVSIVPVNGSSKCRGDNNHMQLEVQVNGQIEDIALDTQSTDGSDVQFRTFNGPLLSGAWTQGWHTSGIKLDYVTNLAVKSTSFTAMAQTALQTQVESLLANANHVSIFTLGFGGDGGHDVHREATNKDGAIVINPTTANPTYLLFHFDNQSF